MIYLYKVNFNVRERNLKVLNLHFQKFSKKCSILFKQKVRFVYNLNLNHVRNKFINKV